MSPSSSPVSTLPITAHPRSTNNHRRAAMSVRSPGSILRAIAWAACFLGTAFTVGCQKAPAPASNGGDTLASTPEDATGPTPTAETTVSPTKATSPADASSPPLDLTPPDDVEQSLAEHAEAVRNAFARYEELEKLIYPFGWVRRQLVPSEVSQEVLPRPSDDEPQRGIIRIQLERVCSMIHPTREEAAADETLLPFAPQATREEMRESPVNPKLEPLELEITYAYQNGRWQRTAWKLIRPQLSRSANWLDRIGIP